ncbi:MAG TPA: carboxymuconolactone decarboxylase family protein [Solirubrobacteraceae bacterium]|jgi:AhpD family alkylhydroperoxidase|nr:carboxymuconolactone decarboxylase family protein [Solirubrobacteraceae bacterium]
MQARINNPVMSIPGALDGIREFAMSARTTGVPAETTAMIELRVSQINGCSVCADMHSRELEFLGCSSERMHTLAAWREAPYFSDEERAALALAEAATRLADRPEAVSDEIWDEAARHYSEQQLAGLVVTIAAINAFNRLNATTRQPTGPWVAQFVEQAMAAKA